MRKEDIKLLEDIVDRLHLLDYGGELGFELQRLVEREKYFNIVYLSDATWNDETKQFEGKIYLDNEKGTK